MAKFFLLFDRGRISDQKEIRNSTEAKILATPTPRLSEAGTWGIKLNLKLILEYQASQLAISILILLSSHCHFDILREGTKKDYLISKLLDQAWPTPTPKKNKKNMPLKSILDPLFLDGGGGSCLVMQLWNQIIFFVTSLRKSKKNFLVFHSVLGWSRRCGHIVPPPYKGKKSWSKMA